MLKSRSLQTSPVWIRTYLYTWTAQSLLAIAHSTILERSSVASFTKEINFRSNRDRSHLRDVD